MKNLLSDVLLPDSLSNLHDGLRLLLLLQSCDVLLRAESLILGRHTLNRQFV
jgi:hypothetical protein